MMALVAGGVGGLCNPDRLAFASTGSPLCGSFGPLVGLYFFELCLWIAFGYIIYDYVGLDNFDFYIYLDI
jgi:hypothetical protein